MMLMQLGTIRNRLTLWYVLLLALTVLGFSLYLQFELQTHLFLQVDASLQVAASQLLVDVDDSVDPPMLRPMSDEAAQHLTQSDFALRLVAEDGKVVADVGVFPPLAFTPPTTAGFETLLIDNRHWRIYTQRVTTQVRQFDVWLQMAQSLNLIYDAQNSLLNLIVIGLPMILIVAALGGMFMANRALRPVDTITRTVQAISATDMTRRIEHSGATDELSRLTETLNSMLDRLQAAFETERRFTADASHELRTPLTAIKGQIDVTLTRDRTPAEYADTLNQVQRETDRLIRLANDLLFLARLDAASVRWQPEILNLSDLLAAVIDQLEPLALGKGLQFTTSITDGLEVRGLPDHLIRLFINLLDNAVKYTSAGGSVSVTATRIAADVSIRIADTGRGIAPEHLPYLFERFYRAERERTYEGGAGLGLAIAYQIARAHDGQIEITSQVGQGTICIVRLPCVAS